MEASKQSIIVGIYQDNIRIAEKRISQFPISFGRSSDCDFQLPWCGKVSSVHGTIDLNSGVISINDLDSKNGIVVGGRKVNEMEIQKAGEVRIGTLILSFAAQIQ